MATYNVDIWLPDASELGYPELGETSRKVRVSLDSALKDVQTGNKEIEIHFEDKVYKRDAKGLNIGNNSVAAISFSEDFAKKWSAENGNVAVLAMMGGELPSQKNFFRLGFSVETIAAILGDQVINDRRVSHVFLIRVKNELGEKFEEEFKRKLEVPSQNCSLDILEIDAKVSKDTKGSKSSDHAENNEDGNLPPTTHTDFVEEKEMGSKVESVISQWLSNYIQHRGEGLNSVVIYGYWEGYWDFVKEVLRCKDFKKKEDWLYVESNYPLFAPLHSSGGSVGINNKEFNKEEKTDSGVIWDVVQGANDNEFNTEEKTDSGVVWDVVQGANDNEFNTEEKVPNDKKNDLKAELVKTRQGNPNNALSIKDVVYCIAEQGGKRVKGNCGKDGARCFANSQRDKTVDPSLSESNKGGIIEEGDGLTPGERERVRCFTGKLMGIESSFNTFAREAVHLLWDAITDAHGRLQSNNQLSDCIKQIRKGICKFLRGCKFYESAHLGSFFFRKDGELFFPLLRYNGELERGREVIVKESCCKEKELTKEAIADQLQRLSDSLNKVTGANIIPRDLEIKKDTEVANVFEQFSETIAKISNGIEIDFVSNYPNTKRIFYIWPEPTEVGGEKKRSHCSIFDEACKTVKGVIQINLKDFDLEDNNAYRVYLVCGDNVSTLTEWVNIKEGTKSDVKAVFAKSRIMAGHADEGKNGIGDVSKFLSDFKGYRYRESAANSNVNFLYFIPEYISEGNNPEGNNSSTKKGTGGRQGGIFMTTRYKLSLFDLQIIENMVSRIFSVLKTCIAEHDALLSNIKSAIGSIMSRNGSHNIGSHVLAALSHNVGTMPDDRVLYQYIQHRMDYIATATTDFPTWYQPTMFVGEIMRNFFIQKHLLDHIAESEGLHAFYFQGNDQNANRTGAIRISVRRLMADAFDAQECVLRPKHKVKQNFVVYDDDHSGQLERTVFDDDVQLAIPAGVVGNHAIYTIIENVLRNAAKHGKSDDGSNLEIAIGFINDEDKEYAEFFIWNKSLKESVIDVENLVNDIRVRMQEPFIDKDGQLRREDWGLAEMKISAGILQRRSISEIGGLEHVGMDHVKDSEWGDREIISPIRVEGENGAFHFGYSFFVPKPKEFLFVFSEAVKIPGWIIRLLRKNGIYLADGFSRDGNGLTSYNLIEISDNDNSQTTHKVEAAYNFSFVVLPQDAIDDVFIKSDSFPFRLMVWKVGEASKQKNGQSKLIWRRDDDTQSLIPEFVEQCEAITALTALQTDCSGGVSIAIAAIKDRVYKKWLEYLESKTRDAGLRKVRRELKVLVNVDGNDHTRGSGRSLISDVDIWKFVFKNLFRTTLRTFCSQHAELAERIAPTIYALSMMNVDIESAGIDPRDDDKQTYNIKKVKELLSRPISASIKEQVRKSLSSMWLYLGFLNVLDADQEELSYVLSKLKMIDNTSEEVQFIEHTSVLDDVKDRFKDLANKYSVARIKEDLPFSDGFDTLKKYFKDHFKCQGPKMEVPSLNASVSVDMSNAQTRDILLKLLLAAYHAADVMLRKYSEQIATLPLIYTAADGNVGEAGADVEQFKERIGVDACLDATRTNLPILYYRHGTNAACSIYNEGLSGSQSCMMQMQAFVRKPNAEFLFQLTESALMRVLIVDERFSRFLCKRKENAKKLSWMNIWSVNTDVLLDPKVTALPMDVDVSHKTEAPLKISMDLLGKGKIPHGKFDILIVHQGIIDKMLGNASPDEVNTVLENLKQSVPYVVVTTGRGIPANIPPVARVLPFSSIERYLFQEYPEKLLLVNAVMSLLPCGRR